MPEITPPPAASATSSNGQDRRYFPRWEVNNRVIYRKGTESFYRECCSKDISCDGASLFCQERLDGDGILVLVLFLSEDVAIYVQGRVLWNQPNGVRNVVGVRFSNISEKSQDMILKHSFNLKKEKLKKDWFEGWNKL